MAYQDIINILCEQDYVHNKVQERFKDLEFKMIYLSVMKWEHRLIRICLAKNVNRNHIFVLNEHLSYFLPQ